LYFSTLSQEETGIWFLLSNSQGLLEVLGFGIAPTLTRRIALAKGKNGEHLDVDFSKESRHEIGNLIVTGRIMLVIVAIISLFASLLIGTLFISRLNLTEVPINEVKLSWLFLCIGFASSVWLDYQYSLLSGLGYVGLSNAANTFINTLLMVVNALVVLAGGGLIELAFTAMLTRISQRFIIYIYITSKKPYLLKFKGKWDWGLAKRLSKISILCWFTFLGKLLLVRTDQYFIALSIGADKIPAYQATYQLVSNLSFIASSLIKPSRIFISQLWQAGRIDKVHSMVFKNSLLGLLIMSCGASFLLSSGRELISLWLGNENFLGYSVLTVLCILFMLEVQGSSLILSARAIGREDFAISSISAGITNLILTYFLVDRLGILGVPVATAIAVFCTTTWFAFYRGLNNLKISFKEYFTKVTLLGITVFSFGLLIELVAGKMSALLFENQSSLSNIVLSILIAISIFIISAWFFLLDENNRKSITSNILRSVQ
ncbi:MAG: lipopolysaccharide biosynthesis protein, partial [Cyanobacteria bacterium J06649_11]